MEARLPVKQQGTRSKLAFYPKLNRKKRPTMTLEFEVTDAHNQMGTRNSCGACPVALALSEAYPMFDWRVRRLYARARDLSTGMETARFALPPVLSEAIPKFDERKGLVPTGKYQANQVPLYYGAIPYGGTIYSVR